MQINTMQDAEDFVYKSYLRAVENIPKVDDSRTRRPDLTRRLLDLIGHPDQGQCHIIVTGSKGKGSTARMISSILSNLGYRVGLFTSPHLVNFNERIRINGTAISDADFIRYCQEIAPVVEEIEQGLPKQVYQGPVGITLAIAMFYFARKQTDFNVIECGRGGTYDDVNVLDNAWAVLTPIMAEHVPLLGTTALEVAVHKAGIIKANTQAVFISKQKSEVRDLLHQLLQQPQAEAFFACEAFGAEQVTMDERGVHFNLKALYGQYVNLSLPLLGTFQADNAATAVAACEEILNRPLPEKTLRTCLANLNWPGRCEIIALNPTVILDGAINAESAAYVKEVITTLGEKRVVSIVGVPADKDYAGVIREVASFSECIIITKPDYSHKVFPLDGVEVASRYLPGRCHEEETLGEALEFLRTKQDVDIILIIGTQTYIGNAKRLWQHNLMDIGL